MNKPITLFEFPFNLGLKEPSPGREPGVRKLPEHLKRFGFHDKINTIEVVRLEPPPYSRTPDKKSGITNIKKIAAYALEQSRLLKPLIGNSFLIVLGGDCSILIGNALALKQVGRFGLFYLDGHTDYMGSHLSETGGAAGMDLAIASGYGPAALTNLQSQQPYFKEEHIWCVGNREYDQEYVDEIMQSEIHYVDLASLRQSGIQSCITEFLQMVQKEKLDGFWIHLDVDVLNDEIMPAVDSPSPDGLWYSELNELLQPLLNSEKATGLQITILDPDLDPTGEYAKEFVDIICEVLNSVNL